MLKLRGQEHLAYTYMEAQVLAVTGFKNFLVNIWNNTFK